MPIPILFSPAAPCNSSTSVEEHSIESASITLQEWIDRNNELPLPEGFEAELNVNSSTLFTDFMKQRNSMIGVLDELLHKLLHEQITNGQTQSSRNKYDRLLQTLEGKHLIRKFKQNVWEDLLQKYRLLSTELKQRRIITVQSKPKAAAPTPVAASKSKPSTPQKGKSLPSSSSSQFAGREFTKSAGLVCQQWFIDHLRDPYPSDPQKEALAQEARITYEQVSAWFINARMRRWKAYIGLVAEGKLKPSPPSEVAVPAIESCPESTPVKKKQKKLATTAKKPATPVVALVVPALSTPPIASPNKPVVVGNNRPNTSCGVPSKDLSDQVVPASSSPSALGAALSTHSANPSNAAAPMQVTEKSEEGQEEREEAEAEEAEEEKGKEEANINDDDAMEMEIEIDISEHGVDRNKFIRDEIEEMLLDDDDDFEKAQHQAALERDRYFVISSVAMVNALPELITTTQHAATTSLLNYPTSNLLPSKKVFLHETSYAQTLNGLSLSASGSLIDIPAGALTTNSMCMNSIPFATGEISPLITFGTSPVRSFSHHFAAAGAAGSTGLSVTPFVGAIPRIHSHMHHHSAIIEPPVQALGMSQEQLIDLNAMMAH